MRRYDAPRHSPVNFLAIFLLIFCLSAPISPQTAQASEIFVKNLVSDLSNPSQDGTAPQVVAPRAASSPKSTVTRKPTVTPKPTVTSTVVSKPSVSTSNSPAIVSCPDLVFVGARGSGEQTPNQDKPSSGLDPGWKADPMRNSSLYSEKLLPKIWMGETLGGLFEKIMSNGGYRLFNPEDSTQNGKSITWLSYGVVNNSTIYPAVGIPTGPNGLSDYLGEVVASNNVLLKGTVQPYTSTCPNAKFIIAGYSQGAAIVRLAVERLSAKSDLNFIKNIQSVVLIADPLLTVSDSRLAIDSNEKRWSLQQDACGLARIVVKVRGCISIASQVILKSIEYSLGAGTCLQNLFDKKKVCTVEGILSFRMLVKSPKTTEDLSKITGIASKRFINVCYNGDLVCAPLGDRGKPQSNANKILDVKNDGMKYHSKYKEENIQDVISKWILKNIN